jgi:LacI family transcriptional regulator
VTGVSGGRASSGQIRKRPVTIYEVARQSGVAPSTVSNAFRGQRYVQPETRERILRTAAELGYRPSAIASSLRLGRTKTLALIGADLADPFCAQILHGVTDAALEQEHQVVVCATGFDHERETQHIRLLLSKRIDGVIIMSSSLHDQNIRWLQDEDVPLVLLSRRPADVVADFVGLDNQAGIHAVVDHLVQLGHRRIAFLGGSPQDSSVTRGKIEAFVAHLAHHDLTPEAILPTDFTYDDGYRVADRLLGAGDQPSAVVAVNDVTALGVIDAALDRGLRVPDDLSVVGWDDAFPAALRTVQLTTVHQPGLDMGRAAVNLLLREPGLEPTEPEDVIFRPRLVVRRTTSPPPASAGERSKR